MIFEINLFVFLPTNGYVLFWYYIFPPVAVLLVGNRYGRYFSMALLLITIIIFAFFRENLSEEFQAAYNIEQFIRLVITFMILTIMIFIFETSREVLYRQLKQQFIEIKEKNEELKAAEEELRQTNEELYISNSIIKEKEKRLNDLLANLSAGFVVVDSNGFIKYINKEAARLYGDIYENIKEKHYSIFFDEQKNKDIDKFFTKVLEGEHFSFETKIKNKEGKEFFVAAKIYPDYDNNNQISGVIALFTDVTERLMLQKQLQRQFEELKEKNEELQVIEEELRQANDELKYINKKIKEKEDWLDRLLTNLGDGLVVFDLTGKFKFVNKTAADMYGEDYERLLDKNYSDYFQQDQLKIINEKIQEVVSGQTVDIEVEAINKNNKTIQLLATMFPEYDSNNKITGIVAIFKDITKIKEYQAQIELQLEQIHRLLETLPAFVFFKDKDLKYVLMNSAYAALIGTTVENAIGNRLSEISPDPKAAEYEAIDRQILETGKGFYQKEALHITESGLKFWLAVSKVPYYDDDGKPIGIVGIIQDFSEMKEKELKISALNEELRKYFAAIQYSTTGIIISDAEGYIEYVNPKFTELTGFSFENLKELTERILKTGKVPKGLLENLYNAIKEKSSVSEKIEFYHRKDQKQLFFEISFTPVYNDDKKITHYVGLFTDITDLENEKLEVQKLNRELNKYFVAIDQSPVGVAFLDKKGIRRYVNKSYLQISGYSEKEAINSISKLFLDETVKEQIYKGVIIKKEITRNNQKTHHERLYLFPIKTENEITDFVLLTDDITLEKQQQIIIEKQRDALKSINEDIRESINYAKHIQQSLMKETGLLNLYFDDAFILFLPKDIISGDFYYIKLIREYLVFAVADCTGHGIPGAFISLLGYTTLNDIIHNRDVTTAADVLSLLRSRIKKIFKEFQGGMDIALCALNYKTNELQYSGAYMPLYLIRGNNLMIYKATRNPIGSYPVEMEFEQHIIKLQKNDIIYLFSDGYVDQYGINKMTNSRQKFTRKKFRELLLSIKHKAMFEQKEILEETIRTWQDNLPQTDDITIMGLRF